MNVCRTGRANVERREIPRLGLVYLHIVMAGLVPAIHALMRMTKNVDARDKPGHDDVETSAHTLENHLRSPCGMTGKLHLLPRNDFLQRRDMAGEGAAAGGGGRYRGLRLLADEGLLHRDVAGLC